MKSVITGQYLICGFKHDENEVEVLNRAFPPADIISALAANNLVTLEPKAYKEKPYPTIVTLGSDLD